jgi:hypothetical protein
MTIARRRAAICTGRAEFLIGRERFDHGSDIGSVA